MSSSDDDKGTPKHAGGRPSKLTEAFVQKFLPMLEAGKPLIPSLLSCDVDDSTFRKWRTLARGGNEALVEFFTLVARSRALGELKLWGIATDGDGPGTSNGPAKCAQWALEKQFGPRYAPRVSVKVEEELETFLDVVERVCGSKDCGCHEALLEAVAARARGEEISGAPGEEGSSSQTDVVH